MQQPTTHNIQQAEVTKLATATCRVAYAAYYKGSGKHRPPSVKAAAKNTVITSQQQQHVALLKPHTTRVPTTNWLFVMALVSPHLPQMMLPCLRRHFRTQHNTLHRALFNTRQKNHTHKPVHSSCCSDAMHRVCRRCIRQFPQPSCRLRCYPPTCTAASAQ